MANPWDNTSSSPDALGEGHGLAVGQYYAALMRAGVPERIAVRLTIEYQREFFRLIFQMHMLQQSSKD